jgi:TPR repeat protein
MYFYKQLQPIIAQPEDHKEKIEEILERASKSESHLISGNPIMTNPFNSTLLAFPQAHLVLRQADLNYLYAAAMLMLSIPKLKTPENTVLSLRYLELSGEGYQYKPSLSRLGWFYSEGKDGSADYEKAIKYFIACDGHGSSWNSAEWCYMELTQFRKAKECFEKTLKQKEYSSPYYQSNKEKAQTLLEGCNHTLETFPDQEPLDIQTATDTISFFAPKKKGSKKRTHDAIEDSAKTSVALN